MPLQNTKICLLCGECKPLCQKSHIIPRRIYALIKLNSQESLKIYSQQSKSKQSQSGIQDKDILCSDCEQIFGVWDKYAQKLLKNLKNGEHSHNIFNPSPSIKYIEIKNFDYKKLKLFFMSVLWRASLTKDTFFKNINLNDQWQSKLTEMLKRQDHGSEDEFSIIITMYEGIEANCMPLPQRKRGKDGINFYDFRLANFSCLIKVDNRKFSDNLKNSIMAEDRPLIIYCKDYKKTQEYGILLKNIRSFKN